MDFASESSKLKTQERKLEFPVLNPSLQNVSFPKPVLSPVTAQENNLAEHHGKEISDPNLLLPIGSKTGRITTLQKTISNQTPSFSNDPSGEVLPLANLHQAKENLSLKKRKTDSSTSSNSKKIMVSHVHADTSMQYSCTICGRSFGSYQALGGHKVHHNKKAPAIDTDAIARYARTQRSGHKCDFCNKVFSTGQALGGHKRHCREPVCGQEAPRNVEIEERRNQNRGLNFDLNKLPEEMDDTIGHM